MQNNWTRADTIQLIKMRKVGCDLESMSTRLGRNQSAVKSKLTRLGYSVKGL